jgi:hypothetical protein
VALAESEAQSFIPDRRELALGMLIERSVKIWRSEGAPVVYLGNGENTEYLDDLLSNPDIPDYQLLAVKAWLDNVLKQREGKSA